MLTLFGKCNVISGEFCYTEKPAISKFLFGIYKFVYSEKICSKKLERCVNIEILEQFRLKISDLMQDIFGNRQTNFFTLRKDATYFRNNAILLEVYKD